MQDGNVTFSYKDYADRNPHFDVSHSSVPSNSLPSSSGTIVAARVVRNANIVNVAATQVHTKAFTEPSFAGHSLWGLRIHLPHNGLEGRGSCNWLSHVSHLAAHSLVRGSHGRSRSST
jgi:hypothetical protein